MHPSNLLLSSGSGSVLTIDEVSVSVAVADGRQSLSNRLACTFLSRPAATKSGGTTTARHAREVDTLMRRTRDSRDVRSGGRR
jgi:hypothetical protein